MSNICFFIGQCSDRNNEWNGEIIRTGGVGVSGTDTSFILIAEYFSKNGWNVSFISSTCKNESTYNGVKYYSLDYFKNYNPNFNIIVIPPSDEFLKYKWKNIDTIIIWCQMQHTFSEVAFQSFKSQYQTSKIFINYMNNFTKNATTIYSPHTSFYIDNFFFIPNPLLNDIVIPETVKVPYSFIFNTSFRRGGQIMLNIFNKLPYINKTLKICSSYKGELDHLKNNYNIQILNSLDKTTLYNNLSNTEYFIYPLVSPLDQCANLHKDTFCCAIAEALLNEVIVLTFPVGAIMEMYGDTLVYLPFPDLSKQSLHKSEYHSSAPELYNKEFEDVVINIIEYLEKNPIFKELLKKRGKEYVINKFNIDLIGKEWLINIF
jgi:hypothetical protein